MKFDFGGLDDYGKKIPFDEDPMKVVGGKHLPATPDAGEMPSLEEIEALAREVREVAAIAPQQVDQMSPERLKEFSQFMGETCAEFLDFCGELLETVDGLEEALDGLDLEE